MAKRRLGERLLDAGLITDRQLAQALQAQQATGEQLGHLLVRFGHLEEADLMHTLCEEAGIPFSDLSEKEPGVEALTHLSQGFAREHCVLPLATTETRLLLAAADPFDMATVQEVERATGKRVTLVGAPRARILELVESLYRKESRSASAAPVPILEGAGGVPDGLPGIDRFERPSQVSTPSAVLDVREGLTDLKVPERGEPGAGAVELVESILGRGVASGATDIHIEPTETGLRVRYRVDGVLHEGGSHPRNLQAAIITRIKVIAGLNIAESRLPQDGRLRFVSEGRPVDLRISTFPTLHGEDLVLRILDQSRVALAVERLGMVPDDLELFREKVHRPYGMILITGPTGSGKTTTLYSALAELNTGRRSILTLEDPVEYELPGIRQSQINVKAGLTFASGLRSLLRHDPDVILVGEMRDEETVQIGLSAAMTGHMMLSTLHTNSAAGAIPRLLDMKAEPYVVASTLQLSVAQRLVRAICDVCREVHHLDDAVRRRFRLDEATVYHGVGCSACRGTGYRGRFAIFEMLPMTQEVAASIYEQRSAAEIARISGRPTLMDRALEKVQEGRTTLDEVLRAAAV